VDTSLLKTPAWRQVLSLLPANWRDLAAEHGLCRSQPSAQGERAKLSDPEKLLRLVLHHVGTETPLRQTTALAAVLGLVDVTEVALHFRMRTVGPWLAQLAALVSGADATFAPARWGGYAIHCTDGTTGTRPGACGTTFRIHYRVEAANARPVQTILTDASGGEMLRNFTIRPGDLDLLDRAYCTAADIAHAVAQGGDVIVRFNRVSLPLQDRNGRAINIEARVRRLRRPGRVAAWPVWTRAPDGSRLAGRIIALRLSDAQAATALERLRREKSAQDITDADRDWAHYVVLFTTTPAARLPAELVVELYRVRWEVELHIKRDKSLGGVANVPNLRADTIDGWVSAKLLLMALARRLAVAPFSPCAAAGASAVAA
jgi:hypothetical protein